MAEQNTLQLAQLVDMSIPAAVFEEVKYNFVMTYPIAEFTSVRDAFVAFNRLYEGKYEGYRACNTKFHDKLHATDALLAVSRLIDGCILSKKPLPVGLVRIALIATLLHDAGYIQSAGDVQGTGAKYTLSHVSRSIDFLREYLKAAGFSRGDEQAAARMVSCTGLGADVKNIAFASSQEKQLGFMLGSADLIGQMSSRTYLERLVFLYDEFKEGRVQGVTSRLSFLQRTLQFYEDTKLRLSEMLGGVDEFALVHFKARYRIGRNLYTGAIERNVHYLKNILIDESDTYLQKLRRIV